MQEEDVRGRRFSILGGARSGVAAAELLVSHGAKVFLSDRNSEQAMTSVAAELRSMGTEFEFGDNTDRVLDADMLVVSPGVRSDAPLLQKAIRRGIPIISELELASRFCSAPIVAITGTNGKTTTTTLAGRMFADARVPCAVAGNIGTAFSQVVRNLTDDAVVVLEVSSFQLDHIATFRPAVAAILNITPDHLDRYEHDFGRYIASKRRIFENQGEGDVLIYNADDRVTVEAVEKNPPKGVTLLPFSTRKELPQGAFLAGGVVRVAAGGMERGIIPAAAISIRGEHNLANSMAAVLAAITRDVPVASLRATLKNFKGVEHRLEFVRELDGITYVNDSKATNVDSVWYALRSFTAPVIVLMGGRDKGNDYRRLREPVKEHVKTIVAIGESADNVVAGFAGVVPTIKAATMESAIAAARGAATRGDIVLLSPACASFDWYKDYEHRGRVFKEIVNALPSKQ
jgi:UDP-N-acetylmuramoylalanine--D-glutamate ligase